MAKNDRRVIYTKMILHDTLYELLLYKTINKISVKELCEKANINRATFYSHYEDIYDLLSEMQWEILNKIELSEDEKHKFSATSILESIDKNPEKFIRLFKNNGDKVLEEYISLSKDYYLKVWEKELEGVTREKAEYLFNYTSSGLGGIIRKWLAGGMKESPKEIGDIIDKFNYYGINLFLKKRDK